MQVVKEVGSREWLKLSAYAAGLTRKAWVEVTWLSVKGGQEVYAYLISSWIRKL